LAELQTAWFDAYELDLTGVVCGLLTLAPSLLVLVAVASRMPPPTGAPRISAAEVDAWVRAHYETDRRRRNQRPSAGLRALLARRLQR